MENDHLTIVFFNDSAMEIVTITFSILLFLTKR